MLFASAEKIQPHPITALPQIVSSSFISNEGARIHYTVYGDTTHDAATLILLHGACEDSHIFDNHIASYARYYRVIAIDSRGCGQSTRGCEELSLALLESDLFAVLNTLHIGVAVILGYGEGANTAINFTLKHQERVAALILVGANLFPAGMTAGTRIANEAAERFSKVGMAFSKRARIKNDEANLATNQPRIDPKDLKRIRVPSLVIAGEKDTIKREHSELIAASLSNARIDIIENAGHCVMKDATTRFKDVTVDFLLEDD
ncbi:MAG: alpha/beta hydrolase [Actinobacteria bacterium]|nr:alpha/beta hydrolase [Actinomycetota bacterium]